MNYHLQTSKRPSRVSKTPLFVLFFVLVLGLLIFKPLSNSVVYLASSLGKTFPIRNIVYWLHSKNTLIKENQTLKQSLAETESKLLDRDILFAENQELRQIREDSKRDFILAEVLLRPGFSPYDTVVIAKGSRDGIILGDSVYFNTLLIGEISEVGEKMSKATLYSSSGKTFPVNINKNRLEAEAKGLGSGTFELMIPNNIKVEKGEIVTFANNPGKVIGVVEDVGSKTENDTFQRVLFSLPININSINFVSIEHH